MDSAKVLIGEDDGNVAHRLRACVEQMGHRVAGASATCEELVAQAAEHRPDVALVSVSLPGGAQGAAAAARELHSGLGIPVIYLAAYGDDRVLDLARAGDAYGCLVKPLRDREVQAAIETALSRARVDVRSRRMSDVLRGVRAVERRAVRERNAKGLMHEACATLVRTRGYAAAAAGEPDADGRLVWTAKAGHAALCPVHGLCHPETESVMSLPCRQALLSGQAQVCRDLTADPAYAALAPHASRSPAGCAAVPIRGNGRPMAVLCVYADRIGVFDDEEMALLKELAETLADAVAAGRQETAPQPQGKHHGGRGGDGLAALASGVAHSLNNILMSVFGSLELAEREVPASSQAGRSLAVIRQMSQRAAELGRQLLAYAGAERFVLAPVDLTSVVEEACAQLRAAAPKTAVLRTNLAARVPAIRADAGHLRHVVRHLAANALEAIGSRPGIVSVTTGVATCGPADLRSPYVEEERKPGPYAFVEVVDTGSGMDREMMARLFQPFATTKTGGHGLSLAAVLGIVRAHGGTVQAFSELGRGTRFRILLPVALEGARPPPPAPAPRPARRREGAVLFVDDEPTIRAVAKRLMEQAGIPALTAADGPEALALFQECGDGIRCVVLDFAMPGMNGDEVFRRLKRIRSDVPVLISSGYSEAEVESSFSDARPDGFLQKPYEWPRLLRMLGELAGG